MMSLVPSPSLLGPCAQNIYLRYKMPSFLQAAQNDPQPTAEIVSSKA